jgi:anhydro-N-acetylmuramic acid kinase
MDRDEWNMPGLDKLSAVDGAAMLTMFTVRGIEKACDHMPHKPETWFVTGGGRHNDYMMYCLRDRLDAPVKPVEDIGWHGDSLEAEGFAYLAVRAMKKMPISVPDTTGVPEALTGGEFHRSETKNRINE